MAATQADLDTAILANLNAVSEGLVAITGLAADNEEACEGVCTVNTAAITAVHTFLSGQRTPDFDKAVEDVNTATAVAEAALDAILNP